MKVITYRLGGELQDPKTVTPEELVILRAFAKSHPEMEIVKVRALRTRRH